MPLQEAAGGREFVARVVPEVLQPFGATGPAGPVELSLPTPEDLPELVALVHESFDRAFLEGRVQEDWWNPFASTQNGIKWGSDRKEVEEGIRFRLGLSMQFPSLRRPVNQDNTLGLMARELRPGRPGCGPLMAYFELCVLPADGRRPQDLGGPPQAGEAEPAPYFSNLCVAPDYRRLGLGRAMLELAEAVVAVSWRDPWVYLHIDDYEPSKLLYASAGYEPVSPPSAEGLAHLRRQVAEEAAEREEEEGAAERGRGMEAELADVLEVAPDEVELADALEVAPDEVEEA